LISGAQLTHSQFNVLLCMIDGSDANRFVKGSTKTLARESGLAESTVVADIKQLVAQDIAIPSTEGYRLERVNVSSIILKQGDRADAQSTQNALPARQDLVSNNGRRSLPVKIRSISTAARIVSESAPARKGLGLRIRGIVQGRKMMIAPSSPVSFSAPPVTPTRANNSAFGTFNQKRFTVATWNARDIVCYYATLFRFEYGASPQINWRNDCIMAKRIIDALGGGENAKRYLQLAFAVFKDRWTMTGLQSLTSTKMMNLIKQRWEDQYLVDDYPDAEVFAR
jgi:hypothetical protein